EKKVIDSISQMPTITIKELVTKCGYSDGYIRKIITSLKNKNIIERQGGKKIGKWIVIG
nr:DeoR family transcriptional regulator [Lachnospiraceae bacterium]